MKSRLRPVVQTQVALAYESSEMNHLIQAVGQLPPFRLRRETGYVRIDCHSLLGGQWRCRFHFSLQGLSLRPAWVLQTIEHDGHLTLREALGALGALEEVGLKKMKHGS